jgi:hypothetical protein
MRRMLVIVAMMMMLFVGSTVERCESQARWSGGLIRRRSCTAVGERAKAPGV